MKYLIGLGPGRCGTSSLTKLLNSQPGVYCTHERTPWLGWYRTVDPRARLEYLRGNAEGNPSIVGDVSLFYLPHVLDMIGLVSQRGWDVKAVCMVREPEANIASMIKKVTIDESSRYNHWSESLYRRPGDRLSNWSQSFPWMALEFEDAIRRYILDYYAVAREMEKAFPNLFYLCDLEDLNTADGVDRLLDFCGIHDRKTIVGVRVNRGAQ